MFPESTILHVSTLSAPAVSAEGNVDGRRVTGRGYVEMTGYAEAFRKKL